MICDQCGFEHNSKGTCPKCGARVVYVNEDYERRRQAYLEAQKKAAAGQSTDEVRDENGEQVIRKTADGKIIPPGVRYSTEDEHNMAKGRDRAPSHYKEENEESRAGKIAVDVLQKMLLSIASAVVWSRKKLQKMKKKAQKKRGVNNPVVNKLTFEEERDLKFDDGKETLDTSKLVLAHKVFKDKRIPIFFITMGGLVLVVGLIVFLAIWTHTDHTKVLIYRQAIVEQSDDSGNPVLTDGLVIRDLYKEGKLCWSAEPTAYPKLTVYTKDASLVYWIASDPDGQNRGASLRRSATDSQLQFALDGDATYDALMISDSGNSAVLTGCIAEELNLAEGSASETEGGEDGHNEESVKAEETYLLYVYTTDGNLVEAARDSYSRQLLAVTDSYVVYEKQATGAYGVITSKQLEIYVFESGRTYELALQYTDYEIDTAEGYAYYVQGEKLYSVNLKTMAKAFLDDEVQAIALDETDAYRGVLYEKSNGYYTIHGDDAGEEGKLILATKVQGLSFYFFKKENVLCLTSYVGNTGTLYVMESPDEKKPQLTQEMASGSTDTVSVYEVRQVLVMENAKALLYVTDSGINVMRISKKGITRLGLDSPARELQNAMWTKDTYALMGTDGILYRFDARGVTMDNVSAYATWCVEK